LVVARALKGWTSNYKWQGVNGGVRERKRGYARRSCIRLQRGIVGRVSMCECYTEPVPLAGGVFTIYWEVMVGTGRVLVGVV